MYCHGPLRLVDHINKSKDNFVAGRWTIDEKQIVVFKTGIRELFCIINFLVQSNYGCHIFGAKIFKICFRCMIWISLIIGNILMNSSIKVNHFPHMIDHGAHKNSKFCLGLSNSNRHFRLFQNIHIHPDRTLQSPTIWILILFRFLEWRAKINY